MLIYHLRFSVGMYDTNLMVNSSHIEALLTVKIRFELSSMSSLAAQELTETLTLARHSFERITGILNTKWRLDIPPLHGNHENAMQKMDDEYFLAQKCVQHISYLCNRGCDLDKVIMDFTDEVPRICSEWKWKPSQEDGTLPKMPITKSFVTTMPAVLRRHRGQLLAHLFDLLDEEFILIRQSPFYRRTSFNAPNDVAGAVAGGPNQGKASPNGKTTTVSKAHKRQAAETTPESSQQGLRETRISRESKKQKSFGSGKVGVPTVAKLFRSLSLS